jgi:hypothetical protein
MGRLPLLSLKGPGKSGAIQWLITEYCYSDITRRLNVELRLSVLGGAWRAL